MRLYLWLCFIWRWNIGGKLWDARILSCRLSQQVSHRGGAFAERGDHALLSPRTVALVKGSPLTANQPTGPPAVPLPTHSLRGNLVLWLPLIQSTPSIIWGIGLFLADINGHSVRKSVCRTGSQIWECFPLDIYLIIWELLPSTGFSQHKFEVIRQLLSRAANALVQFQNMVK